VDPDRDPHQNLIGSCLSHIQHFIKIRWQHSEWSANGQTEKRTMSKQSWPTSVEMTRGERAACWCHACDSASCAVFTDTWYWCTSGCMREWTCGWEVAGLNLGRGYCAPRSTEPSVPQGLVSTSHSWEGKQRQVWLITIADERVAVRSLENTCHTWVLLRR